MQKSVTSEKKSVTNPVSQQFTEEFTKYLKEQSLSAAFNGAGIENFSWYKKVFGIGF